MGFDTIGIKLVLTMHHQCPTRGFFWQNFDNWLISLFLLGKPIFWTFLRNVCKLELALLIALSIETDLNHKRWIISYLVNNQVMHCQNQVKYHVTKNYLTFCFSVVHFAVNKTICSPFPYCLINVSKVNLDKEGKSQNEN